MEQCKYTLHTSDQFYILTLCIVVIFCIMILVWEIQTKEGRLSKNDPHSFAQTENIRTTHIHLELEVDFREYKGYNETFDLKGHVILSMVNLNLNSSTVRIDVNKDLLINGVYEEDTKELLDFQYVNNYIVEMGDNDNKEWIESRKSKIGHYLNINLPKIKKEQFRLHIDYQIDYDSCYMWSYCGGIYHYYGMVYTQNQPIDARTWIPCQDTPAAKVTYTAAITAPKGYKVLMAASEEQQISTEDNKTITKFSQSKPVPTYVIVLAVGKLERKFQRL